jgi:predicted kinase
VGLTSNRPRQPCYDSTLLPKAVVSLTDFDEMSTPPTLAKVFIQMSGAPGSGKSTMSRLLRNSLGGVVIDHDILRSPLLEFKVPFDQAAKQAYQIQWRLAQDFSKQGINIIIDSPCNFQQALDEGSTCAKQFGYTYWYVECQVRDIDQLDQRLQKRVPMTSQRTGIERPPAAMYGDGAQGDEDSCALFQKWIKTPCRPTDNVIIVDSTGDLSMLREQILKQICG